MSNSKTQNIPNLRVTIHKIFDDPEKKIRATASVNIGGAFAVHGFAIWDSDKGSFLAMPSVKVEGEYRETFHPVTREAREQLSEAVFEAYRARLEEIQAQDTAQESPEKSPMQSM